MGAIKSNDNYTDNDWQLSILARALAHPARIQMIKKLRRQHQFRNVDFAAELNMTPSSVNEHVEKLKDAELIRIEYFQHHYLISLNPKKFRTLLHFISENG
jgi:predicted transcriptional regulator